MSLKSGYKINFFRVQQFKNIRISSIIVVFFTFARFVFIFWINHLLLKPFLERKLVLILALKNCHSTLVENKKCRKKISEYKNTYLKIMFMYLVKLFSKVFNVLLFIFASKPTINTPLYTIPHYPSCYCNKIAVISSVSVG
jgi:hypothetical protein